MVVVIIAWEFYPAPKYMVWDFNLLTCADCALIAIGLGGCLLVGYLLVE